MTTILEALDAGLIRFARGVVFDASATAGWYAVAANPSGVAKLVQDAAEKYTGASFVRFDEPIPSSVPLGCPDHTWAEQVVDAQHRPIGVLITWSTEAAENSRRTDREAAESERAGYFHLARGGDS